MMTIMKVTLDPELKLFYDTCKKFALDHIAPHAYEWEEAEIFPRELYQKAAEVGILGAGIPEEYGGCGGGEMFPLITAEALLHGGSTGVVVGLQSHGIGLPPILRLGSEEQKQRFIPPVMTGEKICALGITEAGTGSDVSAISTRAVRDGDSYVLNGNKLFITSGIRADTVSVLARTSEDKHGGLTFFVVEKGMDGFAASRSLKKTGWRASDTAELSFDNVRLPMENRLGAEGSGFSALMKNFVGERIYLAFLGHATAELALSDAKEYATQRMVFGRPVTGYQVNRHKLAHMTTQVAAAKTLNYAVAERFANGEQPVAEVAMAKNFSAQVAIDVCYEAVQLMGGMGYMRESRVERLSRDARLLPIGGGTTEIMNEIIAKWSLGL